MKSKIKKIAGGLAITCICLLGAGCNDNPEDGFRMPKVVNMMAAPVIVLACSEDGIVLQDANGMTATIPGSFYFTKAMVADGWKRGDVFRP